MARVLLQRSIDIQPVDRLPSEQRRKGLISVVATTVQLDLAEPMKQRDGYVENGSTSVLRVALGRESLAYHGVDGFPGEMGS